MNNFEALYYPSFEPPSKWLRTFLLFFDKIWTIVPNNEEFTPSKENSEIINLIPESFATIAPNEDDISLDDLNLRRLRAAFRLIKNKMQNKRVNEVNITFDQEGYMRIEGYGFLHDKKISEQVSELLEEYSLIEKHGLINSLNNFGNFSIVKEEAINLILSIIADKIGMRSGYNTVTDRKIDFTANSLNALEKEAYPDPGSLLSCSIINSIIPEEIHYIDIKKYKQIRDAYADIREPFHKYIIEVNNLCGLNKISDFNILQNNIEKLSIDFNNKFIQFKKSKLINSVKKWTPIGIAGISNIIGAHLALSLQKPEIAIITASIAFSMNIIQNVNGFKKPPTNETELLRLLARMESKILSEFEVKQLLYGYDYW